MYFHRWNGEEKFAPVITVFSAPNYCGTYENKAAVLVSEEQNIDILSFNEVEDQPYLLPLDYPKTDAFTFLHADLMAYSLDFLY